MEEVYVPRVGDLVIINKSEKNWNREGSMDKWIGTVQKIIDIQYDSRGMYINFESEVGDINCWYWRAEHVKPYNKQSRVLKIKLNFKS
jgi:hypothetical protein